MKKIISILLASLIFLSLASCSRENDGEEAETTEKLYQSYDELEYKSDDRFTIEEILTFTHSEGEYLVASDSIFYINGDGTGGSILFSSPDTVVTYKDTVAPFGVKVGDPLSDLEEKFSLDTGYAAYVKKGGSLQMYDSEKETDITDGEGGCIYFGYAKDGTGKWAFMDHTMLTATLSGKLLIQGATEEYNVVVYSCIVGDDLNVSQITVLYGEINTVMSFISN